MRDGVPLTIANIIKESDRDSDMVVDIIQEVIDDPAYDIPGFIRTAEEVARLQELMAYYGNWYATLIGLWGKVRVVSAKRGTGDKNLTAVRDVLEKQASACYRKYESASRALTTFQETQQGQHGRIF